MDENTEFINELLSTFGGKEVENMSPDTNDLNEYVTPKEVKDGDVLIFTDPGRIVVKDMSKARDGSDMRKRLEIEVELPTGKKKLITPNKTSRNLIEEKYGTKTEEWVSRSVRVSVVQQNVGGILRDVIYLKPITE